ncbi:MAG TPA: hypothetical protein VLN45_07050 [Ignavibacteriaceae bacterium]|nr:hypothetical protein [Ignavibacteriaceae bacterium]
MKNVILFIFFFGFGFICFTYAQSKIEEDLEVAYQNAKKGIYWALDNIPEKKAKLENDLIANDILYASVQIQKEVDGLKIESTGYNNSNSVVIRFYKSYDNLVKEGFLNKIPSD